MISRLFLILLIFVPVTGVSQIWKVMATSNESPENYVYIYGETNINCFECMYSNDQDNNSFQNFRLTYDKISGEKLKADIPVSKFRCSNEIMYNDFTKLLKAGEYPCIRIEIDPSQISYILPGKSIVDLNVSITIADITKVQPISCQINSTGNNTMNITGITSINIVDFQLKPPVKFLGLVRVKEEVAINFSFNFIVI